MTGGLLRCPYCHAGLDLSRERWVACAACLARHHRECFSAHEACGTCGESEALDRAARLDVPGLVLAALVGVGLGLAAAPWAQSVLRYSRSARFSASSSVVPKG